MAESCSDFHQYSKFSIRLRLKFVSDSFYKQHLLEPQTETGNQFFRVGRKNSGIESVGISVWDRSFAS